MSTIVSEPPVYLTASPTPPAIKCPTWCVVSQEEHLHDLKCLEGRVMHASADDGVWHTSETYVDGTPDLTAPPRIRGELDLGDGLTLDEAERLALLLLAAVKEARA